LNFKYLDPTDQTSCTAWNYYASATSNAAAQAGVAMRNFAAAYETGYYPIIHCGTSYGHYKETREELLHHDELRHQVRDVLKKLGKPMVMPEEIVHYSEWIHAVRIDAAEEAHFSTSPSVTLLLQLVQERPCIPIFIGSAPSAR
jgi:heterodisulfide reductase subunit B